MQTRVSDLRWRIAQAAERSWWRRYLSKQDPDSYLAWKKQYWRTFLSKIQLSPKPGSFVLDAGCGPAGIFTALPECEVTAIDPLLDSYHDLPHFQQADYPHVEFLTQQLESFDEVANFDYVFCLNVINHVRDLAAVCTVLAKAARPGASVVISVDAHRHAFLKPIFRAIPGDILHPHQLDLADYLALFASCGLKESARLLYKREQIFDYWVITLHPDGSAAKAG